VSATTSAGKATVKQYCEVLRMPRSTYYASQSPPSVPAPRTTRAQSRGVRSRDLLAALRAQAKAHPAWGYRKLWATLRRAGMAVSLRRVYELCRAWRLLLPPDRPNRQPAPRGHVTVPDSNRRWATDLTTVWTPSDGLVAVTVLVDCGDRSVLGLTASKSQDAPTVLGPVQAALVAHFDVPAHVPAGLELRTDHGPQYTGSDCATLCRRWRLDHTLAPVGRPTGNAVAERTIRTLKEECLWLAEFDSLSELQAALDAWRVHFNAQRPHQALEWQTPAERRAQRLGHRLQEAA
jgi:putative transposase